MKITPKNYHRIKKRLGDVSLERRFPRLMRLLDVEEEIRKIKRKEKTEQKDKDRRKQSLMFHAWYRRRLQKRASDKAMRETLIKNGIIKRHINPKCPVTGRFISLTSLSLA